MHLDYYFMSTLCFTIIHSCFAVEMINEFQNTLACRIDKNGQTIYFGTNELGLNVLGHICGLPKQAYIFPYFNSKQIPVTTKVFPHAAMQEHDHWWFEEIAESNKCHDLSRKALLITYRAKTTGPRRIRYHQKLDRTCATVDPTTYTAQIMFYQYIEHVIVPLKGFMGADLSLGYGFTFHGPLDILKLAFVDIEETYQAHVPTTDMALAADHVFTEPSLMINESEFNLKYHEEREFFIDPDLNLTRKIFKIVYSSDFSGVRRLSLVQQGKRVPAQILFTKGNRVNTLVPFSFFLESDLSLGITELVIRGPVTIHQLELVNVPTSQRIVSLPLTQSLHNSYSYHDVSLPNPSANPARSNYLISNETVLDDFLYQIHSNDLRMRISVTFKNNAESIFCEKNVRLFYTQLSHALSRPAGFLPGADKSLKLYPIKFMNDDSIAVEEVYHYLDSIGRLVGSSILHGHLMDLIFSPRIYQNMLGIKTNAVSMEICSFQHPDLVNGKRIYSTDLCHRHMPHHEKLGEVELTNQVKRNIGVFLKGFYSIVPIGYLKNMNLLDLKNLIHGKSDFDLDDWKANTLLDGYNQEDITIQLFWKVLAEWDTVLKSMLLCFVTGSPRVAHVGFKRLNGGLFTIRKTEDQSVLPSSDKCENILNLPAYVDVGTMENQLKYALKDALPTTVQLDWTK